MVINQEKETVTATKGICSFCGGVFGKKEMPKHLQCCEKREKIQSMFSKGSAESEKILHLFVEGLYQPEYWMHLEFAETSTLRTLDSFIRKTWVECCGHMSAFRSNMRGGGMQISKSTSLHALRPGTKLYYDYDFGDTTSLFLKIVSEREGFLKKRGALILARNEMPDNRCDLCGKAATQICAQCCYDGEGWLCDECAIKHECGEETLLPVVNSPRVGVCGYTGD